jgi:hypothetical protein
MSTKRGTRNDITQPAGENGQEVDCLPGKFTAETKKKNPLIMM